MVLEIVVTLLGWDLLDVITFPAATYFGYKNLSLQYQVVHL
jgi:hypothetical protein